MGMDRKGKVMLGLVVGLLCLVAPGVTAQAEGGRQVPHYTLGDRAGDSWDGIHYYLPDGTVVTDAFFCDGTYTYYLMMDGTPMKNRLSYHPDGVHVIYLDAEGHEVFSNFTHVAQSIAGEPVDDLCFFDVYGHMYVDVLTYDQAGKNLYYANPYGVMERKGWFEFSNKYNGGYGYANENGILMTDQYTYDWNGNLVYMEADGHVRGSMTQEPAPNPNPVPDPTPNPNPVPDPAPNPNPVPDSTPIPAPTPGQETGAQLVVNSTNVTLYGINNWAEDYLAIPENMATSFQLAVSGASNPTYRVIKGNSVEVSSDGLITPRYKLMYWYNSGGYSVGYSSPMEGVEPTRITREGVYGESTVRVMAGSQSVDIVVSFMDYTPIYANQVMDQYIAENITASMTAYEKVEQACKFAASYDYSASHSSAVSMIICGGGDCWASTDAIIQICEKLGLKAWSRNGNRDYGSGSGHMNAMVEADGIYYEAEAGYNETAPRYYYVKERDSLYSYRYNSNYNGIELYQYDGPKKIAVHEIPEEINGQKVVGIGESFLSMDRTVVTVKLPSTLRYINSSAFNSCTELQNVDIPASVEMIKNLVFTQCPKLVNLTCDSNNPYFSASDGCLYNKDKTILLYAPAVGTLAVPNTVKTIGAYAFYYNSNLTSVTIPESVTSLEEGAFGHCNNMKEAIFVGNSLESLGDYAFAECDSLEKIVLPASLTTISNTAFYNCSGFTIYAPKGSYAETYAVEKGYSYVN